MTAIVASTSDKGVKLSKYILAKVWSIPGIAALALIGLLLGMCVYFGPLETYAPITSLYHTLVPNDYWRHLLFRAYPETTFAAWFAQCAAFVAVVDGAVKRKYRIFRTNELFWRPVVGLIFTIPGAAAMAGIFWLWNKYGIGSRVTSAAHAFCHAGSSGHCLSNHAIAVINSHPGLLGQFEQSTVLDGQKKLIVLAGSFIFGLWWMKSYFYNVQGWLAEHSVISTTARNKARVHKGKQPVFYTRWYHYVLPGFMERVKYAAQTNDLHTENHRTVNNVIYRAFLGVTVAGIIGGAYIMFFISQGTNLALVVH